MIHFAWPLVFLIFPLPLLIRGFVGGMRENPAAINVPFFNEIKSLAKARKRTSAACKKKTAWVLWGLLVLAAARPQMPDGIQNYTTPVRDIMLVLDISRSMLIQDVGQAGVNRLTAVKAVAADFVKERKNDRLGIVLFSEQANLYMPLSVDRKALQEMIGGIQVGWLGSLTAIGDATGLALRYLESSQAQHRIIILLTDGGNNAGTVAPEDAVKMAADKGVKLYTIGVGTVGDRDKGGVDAAFLSAAARATNGLFFMAHDAEALAYAYQTISDNEPLSEADVYLMRQRELYFWPLLVFACLITAGVIRRLTNGEGG